MDLFRVEDHLAVLQACERPWRGHSLPMATPAGARYPYVYPRDLAAIARAYVRLPAEAGDFSLALAAAADFLVLAQGADGLWGQRYDLDGRDESIYHQEDNAAHAVATIARHVRHERWRGRVSPIEDMAFESMRRGLDAARTSVYRKGINLFWSTTSVHESQMERGYTLWTNGAYRDAYRLAVEAAESAGRMELADEWSSILARHEENMKRHFVHDDLWIARLTPTGRYDRRADVTLLSPYYFGFEHLAPEAADRSAERVEKDLWDPDIGLLQRYLPFREDMAVHLHAGNGPWLAYTAWLAQRHAAHGRADRAREILSDIAALANPEGHLPEHVSTAERFHDFMENEWETGLDFKKEFDPLIMLPEIGFTDILDEAVRMKASYEAARREAERSGDGVIRFATPLAWSHAEFAVALSLLARPGERVATPPRPRRA